MIPALFLFILFYSTCVLVLLCIFRGFCGHLDLFDEYVLKSVTPRKVDLLLFNMK